jgi:hypothetical protein
MLSAESYLEFRHLLWREVDRQVLALCERPLRIDEYVHGEHLKYTFDAWIRRQDGQEIFIEVKPKENLLDGVPARWRLIRTWCEGQGITCDWVTDAHLAPHQILLDNWEQALPYVCFAQRRLDAGLRDSLRELFQRQTPLTLASVPGFLMQHDSDRVMTEVFYLIYHGELHADLTRKPLSRSLVVHASGSDCT